MFLAEEQMTRKYFWTFYTSAKFTFTFEIETWTVGIRTRSFERVAQLRGRGVSSG